MLKYSLKDYVILLLHPASLMYWVWKVVVLFFFVPIYVSVVAEGVRRQAPMMMGKLSFGEFEATWDYAVGFSLFLMLLVWWVWIVLLTAWMGAEIDSYQFNREKFVKGMTVLGMTAIVVDAWLFHSGIVDSAWGRSAFSFSALLMTAGWIVVIIFVSLVSCILRAKCPRLP